MLAASLLFFACVAMAQGDSATWKGSAPKDKSKPVTKAPPRRRPAARRPVREEESTPLLSVQFRIIKVGRNNSQVEINPLTSFNAGDRLRFAVKSNQNVYLYVIQQKGPEQAGKVFFPDLWVRGRNLVVKDQEFVVPHNCQSGVSLYDCSYEVDSLAGQEYLTFIFSRSEIINFSENVSVISNEVSPQALDHLLSASEQKLDTAQHGDTIFSLRMSNLNPKADEKIVVRYVLSKRGRAPTD
jgi:hypothetical protein